MTRFELIHRNSSLKGQRISLVVDESESGFVIGRSRQSTLLLPTPDVSRHHCRLNCVQGRVKIVDLGSRAGTIVNRQRVGTETPTELKHRDKLQIGKWKFRFLDTEVEDTSPIAGTQLAGTQLVGTPPARTELAGTQPANSMDVLLSELDDIANQFGEGNFTSSNTITLDSIESERVRAMAEELKASTAKEAATKAATERLSAQTGEHSVEDKSAYKSDLEAAEGDAVAAATEKNQTEERFKKIPDHLRTKGPANSTSAAQEALKRIFGG